MVEWSITAVLKTAVPRGTGGSNPSLSAKLGVNQVITRFTPFFTYFLEIIILMLINNFIADEKKKNIRGWHFLWNYFTQNLAIWQKKIEN